MSKAKGTRLWLREARRDSRGKITRPAVWIIRDGDYQESTKCGEDDRAGAERQLETYLNRKHTQAVTESKGSRDPDQIAIADVLALYATQIVPTVGRPREYLQKVDRLLDFFGERKLSDINGDLCRAFTASRSTRAAAREDLVILRSAINHHREEGHCEKIVSVVLPEKSVGRERWCPRSEIARLIWEAWRYREKQNGNLTDRRTRQHVARFILIAVYTGTRAGAVCAAALEPTEGRGWIDLERGIFFRRPEGERETKKRKPPVPLPQRLLAHLRRWHACGQRSAVEWNGEAVKDCDKAFRNVAYAAGLPDVTPHVLRHTAATWLMQAGADVWQSAGYLGMTVETLQNRYGHHHPDYLDGARSVFDLAPAQRPSSQARGHQARKSATGAPQVQGHKRAKTAPNVTKIANYSR
jgi:integrase